MSKKDILLGSLLEFYKEQNNFDTFLEFIEKKSDMALRTLDWFSTNYTKYKKVIINGIDIQCDYRQQLKGYQKEFFDPFRRKDRVYIRYEKLPTDGYKLECISEAENEEMSKNESTTNIKTVVITTVGQLNFFRWAIRRGIINYINNHIEDIQNSQNILIKKRKGTQKGKIIKPGSVVHKTILKVVVDFA